MRYGPLTADTSPDVVQSAPSADGLDRLAADFGRLPKRQRFATVEGMEDAWLTPPDPLSHPSQRHNG